MAVKMRLRRMGAKKRPFYRIVVADSRFPRDGRFIEEIGYYNPIENPTIVKVDKELALKWLNMGATPTDTVRDILSKEGILKEFHESKVSKKVKSVKKETKKEAKKETKPTKTTKASTTKTTKASIAKTTKASTAKTKKAGK